jgi:hypothetical protein
VPGPTPNSGPRAGLAAGATAVGGLAKIAKPWRGRVDVVTGRSDDAPSAGMLIRPDGDVAWDSAEAGVSVDAHPRLRR